MHNFRQKRNICLFCARTQVWLHSSRVLTTIPPLLHGNKAHKPYTYSIALGWSEFIKAEIATLMQSDFYLNLKDMFQINILLSLVTDDRYMLERTVPIQYSIYSVIVTINL